MKVTKHGNTFPSTICCGICPRCSCEFDLEEGDKTRILFMEKDYSGADVNQSVEVAGCPECEFKKVPTFWRV